MKRCDGCSSYFPDAEIKKYNLTTIYGEKFEVKYCSECADLALENWNGSTNSLEEMPNVSR